MTDGDNLPSRLSLLCGVSGSAQATGSTALPVSSVILVSGILPLPQIAGSKPQGARISLVNRRCWKMLCTGNDVTVAIGRPPFVCGFIRPCDGALKTLDLNKFYVKHRLTVVT